MDLKEEAILGDAIHRHWYYQNKAAAVLRYLSDVPYQSILDIGAGSGFFTRHLLSHTDACRGLCVDISYPGNRDDVVAAKPIQYRTACDAVAADLVLLMDVLEHVDDDIGLLQAYAAKVPAGAYFLMTVPAFQFLWSGHDVFLEHRRRYTLSRLDQVVRQADLEPVKSSYYFGAVFPLAAGMRLMEKWLGSTAQAPKSGLQQHHPATNAALSLLCRAEMPFLHRNRLAGLSVFCLGRKR